MHSPWLLKVTAKHYAYSHTCTSTEVRVSSTHACSSPSVSFIAKPLLHTHMNHTRAHMLISAGPVAGGALPMQPWLWWGACTDPEPRTPRLSPPVEPRHRKHKRAAMIVLLQIPDWSAMPLRCIAAALMLCSLACHRLMMLVDCMHASTNTPE